MGISGIQLAISITTILGAAALALLCDYLRQRNAELRDAVVEMKRQAPQSAAMVTRPHVDAMFPDPPPAPADAPAAAPEAQPWPVRRTATPAVSEKRELVRKPTTAEVDAHAAKAAFIERAKAAADGVATRRGRVRPVRAADAEYSPLPEMASQEAVKEWLIRRAAERAAERAPLIAHTHIVNLVPSTTELDVTPVPVEQAPPVTLAAVGEAEPVVPVVEAPAPVVEEPLVSPAFEIRTSSSDLPPVQIDAALWEALFGEKIGQPIARTAEAPVAAKKEHSLQLIAGANSMDLLVPAGMHDSATLSRLLASTQAYTGLVVNVVITEAEGGSMSQADLIRSVEFFLGSLLREREFACRNQDNEFVLLCPGEKGPDAHRRLASITEQLWDFQIRNIGNFSIMFSSGGVEVTRERLSDALAAAAERVNVTRKSRKPVAFETITDRKKAV